MKFKLVEYPYGREMGLIKIQFGSYKEQTIIRLGIFTDGVKFRLPLYLKKNRIIVLQGQPICLLK